MTAPTSDEFEHRTKVAIEASFSEDHDNFQSSDVAIEESINLWWWSFQQALWQRWDCESDRCPGTPAWDSALGDEGQAALDAAVTETLALVRQRMAEFAERFQAEHPEAVLREVETSD